MKPNEKARDLVNRMYYVHKKWIRIWQRNVL